MVDAEDFQAAINAAWVKVEAMTDEEREAWCAEYDLQKLPGRFLAPSPTDAEISP